MAYTKEILTLAVEIGDCMLRNGAEIYRVEMRTRRMPAASCATYRLVLSIWQRSVR